MIINGIKIEGSPKTVKVAVKGQELELTLVHIADTEKVDAKFNWIGCPEGISIESTKVGNRVSNTIYKEVVTESKKKGKDGEAETKTEKQVIFECLTAQSVFQILNVAFGVSASKADSMYKKSNPTRKEGKAVAGVAKVEVKGEGAL